MAVSSRCICLQFLAALDVETLLTQAVHQAGGRGDSVRAVWGLLLLILPFCFFALAATLAALQARGRAGLRGG